MTDSAPPLPSETADQPKASKLPCKWASISRALCAIAFIAAGVNHFVSPSMYCKIMPAYLPFPLELVYVSGVFEVLGGLGLFIPKLRLAAVWGLILLLIAVFPANINMAMHPELVPKIPIYILYARLPLQILLIAWVWSCRSK